MKQWLPAVFGLVVLSAALCPGAVAQTAPGVRTYSGKITEVTVPTPKFAQDLALAPDGGIFIAITSGNRVARFDPDQQTFREWEMPSGTNPHGVLPDSRGLVWLSGNGNGTLSVLDTASGAISAFKTPSGGGGPHTLVAGAAGDIWFTGQSGNYLARFERSADGKTGRITEIKMPGGPQGLTIDRQGVVWVCRYGADKLGRFDPKTGKVGELSLGSGARPRRIATAPDGSLWVTLYGRGALAHVDAVSGKLLREYALPAGPQAGPFSVAVDAGGKVWVNEIESDSVVRFDPADGTMRVFNLPSKGAGIRKLLIDGQGRVWYVGSHNGRLGVIE